MQNNFKRLLAGLIDLYVGCLLGTVVFEIVTLGRGMFIAVSITTYTAVALVCLVLKDCVFKNASIGKRIFKFKLEKKDGSKLTITDIIKRNMLMLVLLPIEGILLMLNNERLGDNWAKTVVVEE